jgi:glycine/D-amino acid oxidase-like deaminating enzyme
MSHEVLDYLIVGQGLAGTVLSDFLLKNGKKVLVFNSSKPNSSSNVAAGIFNPITGRRVVKSWMADTLIPYAFNYYKTLENDLKIDFFHPMDVVEVINNIKDLNEWQTRTEDESMKKYLMHDVPVEMYRNKINSYQKLFRINASGWMNISKFIEAYGNKLRLSGNLKETIFDFALLKNEGDLISYKEYKSRKIIFCEGPDIINNPFWNWLPMVPAKGEILTIECIDFPEDFILLNGIFILPIGKHQFRAGATYEWNYENDFPTEDGKSKLLERLKSILKVSFKIIDHKAAIRPTVKDRRPLLGQHKVHKNIFIFNGMGTKGVLLAPYFAAHFIDYLNGNKLLKEVDVCRFTNTKY